MIKVGLVQVRLPVHPQPPGRAPFLLLPLPTYLLLPVLENHPPAPFFLFQSYFPVPQSWSDSPDSAFQ